MKPLAARHRAGLFLLLLGIGIGLVLAATPLRADDTPLRGRVTWVHDGDTIEVAGIGRVRLLGIDTPERDDSDRDRYLLQQGVRRATLRRIAGKALAFNIATVKGRTVTLAFDREDRDRYGRYLAYVTLPDGRLLNRLLIEEGYAVVYRRFDFRRKADFLAAEAEARKAKVGLWAK